MNIELDKKRFFRNACICVIAFILVALILNISPGYRRDKYANVINLIINDENVTENLKNMIYVNNNGTVYISEEDIANFFDSTIYYDETYNLIVTTSKTNVANIELGKEEMTVNNSTVTLNDTIIKVDNKLYIPISELTSVYNIELKYVEETKRVIVDELSKGKIQAEVEEETVLKFKPRALSKDVGKISVGEEVSCFYTTSKGWRLIRTSDGTLGYVKANVLANEHILRQDSENEIKTKEITISLKDGTTATIQNDEQTDKIIIENIFTLKGTNITKAENVYQDKNSQIWATISNTSLESQTSKILADYKTRTAMIDIIVDTISKSNKGIKAVNIDFKGITNTSDFNRFIIELAPRLRDIDIETNVIVNNEIKSNELVGIVEYLIHDKD